MIASSDDAAAIGLFTIEPESGRVLGSELVFATRQVVGRFVVVYAEQPALKLWLPASMTESYTGPASGGGMSGRATYSNFRMFRVETSTDIGK